MSQGRYRAVTALLIVLVIAAFMISVGWGTIAISPAHVAATIIDKLGISTTIEVPALQATVLWSIRLPRVLMALIVGGALAMSGIVLQAVFRNPLAEPSLLGISGGAVVGAMLATVLRIGFGVSPLGLLGAPLAGFIGALLVSLALYSLFHRSPRRDVTTFLLNGVIANVILGALITLLPAVFREGGLGSDSTYWTMGGLGGTLWSSVHIGAPVVFGIGLLWWRMAPKLNLMALGDTNADHLGVDTRVVRLQSIVLVALMTGVAVAFSGVIAFVGLVVPHALRLMIGPDHRRLLLLGALGGALMVMIADLFSRTLVAPTELPVSVLTTLVGGPLFFWLLRRGQSQGRWV